MKREPIWWLPLLRRTLGWGLAMAGLWCFPVASLLVLLTPGFLEVASSTSFALLCLVAGFVTGAVCGLVAPPTESADPIESRIFKATGLETAVFFFGIGGGLILILSQVVNRVVSALFTVPVGGGGFVWLFASPTAIVLIWFAFCLWLALTRALRVARKGRP